MTYPVPVPYGYLCRKGDRATHRKPVMRFGRVVQITIPELQLHAKHVRLEVLPGGEVRVAPSDLSGVCMVVDSFI